MDWSNKRVFITGGTSGIGRALAVEAGRRGADVWICALTDAHMEEVLDEVRAVARSDARVGGIPLDISDRAGVLAHRDAVLEGLGGLDVLINNAGVATVGYLEDTPPEDYERMMAVNYFGTVWVTRAFLPHFMARGSGAIACVSSTLGLMGLFGYTAYSASKFAVAGYCECLRQDLLGHGVSVHIVIPADVDTPQLRANLSRKPPETHALAGTANLLSAEFVAGRILDGIGRGRYRIAIGGNNQVILWLNRVVPSFVRWYIDRKLTRYWRDHPRRS